jgi:hypothetical protein
MEMPKEMEYMKEMLDVVKTLTQIVKELQIENTELRERLLVQQQFSAPSPQYPYEITCGTKVIKSNTPDVDISANSMSTTGMSNDNDGGMSAHDAYWKAIRN